jgi:hypothetical protein
MRKTLALGLPLLSVLSVAVACQNKPPNPPPTPTPVDAGAPADAGPAEAGVAITAPPPSDAGPVGPSFFTDAGAAPPVSLEAAFDTAIDLAITTAAPKLAPKMDKEGQPARATLKEGEHFGMVVSLAPGRCYTFIGFSPPGQVSQLDLKLLAMPLNVEAGKSGATDKAMPVMGKGTAAICPVLPVAVPYKLDVAATKGAGRMGVYVYARNK